jgi:hypothetical protein
MSCCFSTKKTFTIRRRKPVTTMLKSKANKHKPRTPHLHWKNVFLAQEKKNNNNNRQLHCICIVFPQ